jgi:dTDP-4-dehydrorhamnose 3,5-epimerase
MNSAWSATKVRGVLRRELVTHPDDRGSFTELWRASWTDDVKVGSFKQANLSRSRARVLRGMHFHRRQTDLWIVLKGRVTAVVADIRYAGAPNRQRPALELHELAAGDALLIPELVAHGFYAHEELDLVYLVTAQYDSSDEHGFAWNDPDVAIQWPDPDPILSNRDRSNPPLRELMASLG